MGTTIYSDEVLNVTLGDLGKFFVTSHEFYLEAPTRTEPSVTFEEALAIFPQAKKTFKALAKEKKSQLKALKQKAYRLQEKCHNAEPNPIKADLLYGMLYAVYLEKDIRNLENTLKKILFATSPAKGKLDVEKARQVPISSLLEFNSRGYCKCVFHSEKTPSMLHNKDNNTYHCFGCGAHGDVISLAQHLWGCDFKEAVKRLCQ